MTNNTQHPKLATNELVLSFSIKTGKSIITAFYLFYILS